MGTESKRRQQWKADERALAAVGAALQHTDRRLIVEVPTDLAEAAVAAWARDDEEASVEGETFENRVVRHRAGTLALIGLALSERGRRFPSYVRVELDAWLVGRALDAADDHGLIVAAPERAARVHEATVEPQLITVDLDLAHVGEMPCLTRYLGDQGVLLDREPADGVYYLCFEHSETFPSLAETLRAHLDIVESLPDSARVEWATCTQRVLNVGIEAGLGDACAVIVLPRVEVARSAAVGLGFAITNYPHHSTSRGTSRYVRTVIE